MPTDELKKNLAAILDARSDAGIPVILAGMEAPPNNGPDYTRAFRSVYPDSPTDYKVRFIPFLLQGVAGDASLNQADGIHPNARGARDRRRPGVEGTGARCRVQLIARAQAASPAMIQLRGVSKTVQSGGQPLTILHPLDLDVADGQCLAIIGPSGSGKSTLLGLIAGLDSPSTRHDHDRRHRHHARSTKTRWRGCAARRSASSSSSSTSCRR